MNLPQDVKTFSRIASLSKVKNIIYRRGMDHPIKANFINKWIYPKYVTAFIANSQKVKESIYKYISENLSDATIKATQKINETIYVTIAIDNKGKPSVSKITATESMYTVIPKIDSLIVVSLQRLPKLYPAIKRGIPVATQYQIPIQITVK